jgi:Tol biopolymer transport system component
MKPRKFSFCLALLLSLALTGVLQFASPSTQKTQSAEALLGAALHQEEVEGNLEAAIETYKKFLAQYGDNKPFAARAQLHIGMCYEKLGLREAQNAYQCVIDSYPQQTEAVKLARQRLANLLKAQAVLENRDAKLTIRKVWETRFNDPLGPPSPDGRYLPCYDENGNVALSDLTTGKIRRVTDGASWNNPFADAAVISPDGRRIAIGWFNTDNFDELRLANIDGSENRLLYRSSSRKGLIPSDWSADGKRILAFSYDYGKLNASKETEIVVVSAENGQFTTVKRIPGLRTIRFSPNGRFVVFDALENENWDISILPLNGGNQIQLVSHPAHDQLLGWTPDGKNILFTSDRKGTWGIWMVSVKDGQPQGAPQLVKADIGRISPLGFTKGGSFYFSRGGWEFDVHEASIDLINNKLLGPQKPAVYEHIGQNMNPAWSDDGRYLAYVARPADIREKRALFIRDEISGKTRSLVPNLPGFADLFWSPDGSRIAVYGRDQDHGRGYYSIDIQSGAVTPIVINQEAKEFMQFIQWGSGSRTVFIGYKEMLEIREKELNTGKENVIYRAAQKDVRGGLFALSSDRARIAFKKWQAGEEVERLTIMNLDGKDSKDLWTVQPPYSITHIVWTPDNRSLLFSQRKGGGDQSENELWIVGVDDGEAKRIGILNHLAMDLRVHPNGRRIAFSVADKKTEVWTLENFSGVRP